MELQQITIKDNNLVIGFAESRIGGRRENQDSYGYAQTYRGFIVTVCDGMGGGPGGKTASSIAVREIVDYISTANSEEDLRNIVIKAIRRANMAIIEAGNENQALKGMGSTATVLLINKQSAIVAHVGDSRVYQIRGKKKVYRTFDHSMVFDLVSQGIITEEQARLSAQSNVITRALGIKPDVEVEITEVPYERNDRFMLTTDGIHGTMPETELIKLATKKSSSVGAICDNIATIVDKKGRDNGGGHDNLTIALIETKTDSQLKIPMSRKTKILMAFISILCVLSIILNIVLIVSYNGYEELQDEPNSLKEQKLIEKGKNDAVKVVQKSTEIANR